MPQTLTREGFAAALRQGRRVYWPGACGSSPVFEAWLREDPQAAAGCWFCGVWIPGVNRFDPTTLDPRTKASSFFVSADQRAGWERGATELLPLHYSEALPWLGAPGRFDLALLHVAPPDDRGRCSLSLAADFTPAVLAGLDAGATVLAHFNPMLPRTHGPWVAVERISACIEAPAPPLTIAPESIDPAISALAHQVLPFVHEGQTLQVGIGRLQAAVMAALVERRGLRLHGGMVSDGLMGLVQAGALAPRSLDSPPVCAGVALGSDALYALCAEPGLVRFAPVSHTHALATLASIPALLSINAALEVDLFGQVNAEQMAGRQVSGVGGLADFVRGARASRGGRAIVALASTAQQGRLSRIVARLAGPASVSRADVDTVVTEHGAAQLRGLSSDARAEALIAIAAPAHRAELADAWHTLRRAM